MKKRFWASDWWVGAAISVLLIVASQSQWLQGLERTAYDYGVRASTATPSDQVAVIAIDDESIANLGRWPWPRDLQSEVVDILVAGGAKVVGSTIFLSEPQTDPGVGVLEQLGTSIRESGVFEKLESDIDTLRFLIGDLGTSEAEIGLREFFVSSDLATNTKGNLQSIFNLITAASAELDGDARLRASIEKLPKSVLPMHFTFGEPLGNPDSDLPGFVTRFALPNVIDESGAVDAGAFPFGTEDATIPTEVFGEVATALGHLNATPDIDGGIRTEPLVIRHFDAYYPSLALMIAASSLNLGIDDIVVSLGEGVSLGRLTIKTDPYLRMNTFFYSDENAFQVDSFFDVLTGRIPAGKYKGKIVLLGATATGVGSAQVTPVSPAMPPVVTLAHSVSSILNEDFFVSPGWAAYLEWGLVLLAAAFLIAVLPRLRAGPAAIVTGVLVLGMIAAHFVFMTTQGTWLKLMLPVVLLIAGYILLTTKRFLLTEQGKERSDQESAESNRMLGLAFQGQGQLDMAFEKFRKCPLDDSIMDLLYNLALDFERKRQFSKAGAVFQYMGDHDIKFRDIENRIARSKALEETVMLGSGQTGAGTLLLDGGGVSKPMLGRYEVEKELGKGAMGVVYLGKDPKINRTVAIKTMALSQEFYAAELDEVKDRFFRDAQTAGRLNHPNIVTIFDAGEEHDLAYIAMEFLKGEDLSAYTKPDNLLPLGRVIDLVASAANALDYAHSQNVVHRDIKPANIMYQADAGVIKLTDFGIARITDSSKTKTGMVLGTPSYMSPEQLSGKRVDGRSDLFSLGVMLYQLLTGQLPFRGDSMATLMFKIANEPHGDILKLRADLPPKIKLVVDQALKKDSDERFQTGSEMEQALRACIVKAA
ncbi:MAG: serine/threonine-protein kinase [Pseudomonadota bacterium]